MDVAEIVALAAKRLAEGGCEGMITAEDPGWATKEGGWPLYVKQGGKEVGYLFPRPTDQARLFAALFAVNTPPQPGEQDDPDRVVKMVNFLMEGIRRT